MPSCPRMQKAHPPHPTPHQSLHGMLIQEQGIKTEVQIEQREREKTLSRLMVPKYNFFSLTSGICYHINRKN